MPLNWQGVNPLLALDQVHAMKMYYTVNGNKCVRPQGATEHFLVSAAMDCHGYPLWKQDMASPPFYPQIIIKTAALHIQRRKKIVTRVIQKDWSLEVQILVIKAT